MSRELIKTLREYADKAEAGDKLHWADAMRQAAQYIKDDLDMTEPLMSDDIRAMLDAIAADLEKLEAA